MGFVYLILEVSSSGNESHKIGISKNDPTKRVKQLQTGNSNKLSLLTYYESKTYKEVESWLHSRYSRYKTLADNEWFILPDEVVQSFLSTCQKVDETINLLRESKTLILV